MRQSQASRVAGPARSGSRTAAARSGIDPLHALQEAVGNQTVGQLIQAGVGQSPGSPGTARRRVVVASPAVQLAMRRINRAAIAGRPVAAVIQRYAKDDIEKRAKKIYDQRVVVHPPGKQTEAERKTAAEADWTKAEDDLKHIETRAHQISEDRQKNPGKYPTDAGDLSDWLQAEKELDLKQLESLVIRPAATAGDSEHPTLAKGATNDVAAVTELQQKLATSPRGPTTLVADGVFNDATELAVKAFRKRNGMSETGVVDKATWDLLDAQGKSSEGRIERPWQQTLLGVDYGMTSKYSYKIDDKKILVSVGINFVADTTHPPANLNAVTSKWTGRIEGRWNQFKAIQDGGSESRDIVFKIVASGGNDVTVIDAMVDSDAENWSVPGNETDNGPAHEFGHLIGLADEYTQSLPEYERLNPGASKADIASAKGAGGYGAHQYTNVHSMMGLGALKGHADKTADPEPRHVREFALFVAKFLGGRWEAVKK